MDEQTAPNPTLTDDRDLTAVLGGQHARVRDLFVAALSAAPEERGRRFTELARLLALHEAAEQECLHVATEPAADTDLGAVPTADATDEQVSAQRLREEEAAGQTLQNLEGMDPTSLSFRQQLELLQEAVGRHAEAEEAQEVPRFLAQASAEQRHRAVVTLQRVEELAADVSVDAAVPTGLDFAQQLAAARRVLRDTGNGSRA